jgi:MGT family glycosyltransferase
MRPREGHHSPLPRRLPDAPLVLVSLSTTQQHQGALLQRLCAILGRLPVEAIITTGRAVAPESLSAPPNVTLVRHHSHDAILPEASLLITHAGLGTVLAGAEYGVPMLCLPMGRDQPANARRVADLGFGLASSPEAADEDLMAAINRLLSDGAIRLRCSEFARRVANLPGVERAADLVEGIAAT